MSTPETLHDCPNCGRTKFTAAGLRSHKCKPVAITVEPETTLAPMLPKLALVSTFTNLQDGIKGDALSMKIKMFFAGLLVNELTEHFRHEHGETRGRPENNGAVSVIKRPTLESYLEDNFNVSARTCRRYESFWENCTVSTKHEKAVKALNLAWTNHLQTLQLEAPKKAGKGKGQGKASQPLTLTLHQPSKSFAEDVQELLLEADDLGLHELFEIPLKDAGSDEDDTDPEPANNKDKLIKFWAGDFSRRLSRREYMKLPKAQRETLATDLELALHELKDSLATSKKKGKA
ncbi:MAG: hypothetical protein K9N47_05690 [Prosthecobacter sp.]|uniref:hypothetical protein n=1 Tax=Prosthecobacter sp. TaxID=1965333 RepID=UPI0025EB9672|nr:hypothetical protein [Prosthecobacter sp.]MCF7785593.1 hypothetical protein [Prosthecobacter sp.]